MKCINCQVEDGTVFDWSFDLDLPHLRLCRMCSILIVSDPAMFNELTKPAPRRSSHGRSLAHGMEETQGQS